jgi:hypothetical protein
MHGEHNLLLGLTNDAFGYILTKVDWNSFERYNYITRTSLGEMTGEIGPRLRRSMPPPGRHPEQGQVTGRSLLSRRHFCNLHRENSVVDLEFS